MSVISVRNLTKVYKLYDHLHDRLKEAIHPLKRKFHRNFYALKDVSFDIQRGETVGIIGKNGSGKSTLLKLMTGLLTPTSGSIIVNGKVSALLELGAGFNPDYTGIENIYLNGMLMGFKREEMDAKLEKIVAFADIGDFIYQPVKMYSSGMYVRLAFAVAINVDPDILIVDEALAVGDIAFQLKCYNKFNEFQKDEKTIIFVTHALDSVMKYCSKVFILHEGKIIEKGKPAPMVDVYKKLMVNCYEDEPKSRSFSVSNIFSEKPWKEKLDINIDHLSYGNKKAEIIDYGIFDDTGIITNTILKNKECMIKMKVIFYQEIDNPIFAYTIKNIKGTEITGTNTVVENIYTGRYFSRDIATITFKQKFSLQNAYYTLSLGCTNYNNGELEVYHRLYDICILEFISEKNTTGFFDPQSTIEIIRSAS